MSLNPNFIFRVSCESILSTQETKEILLEVDLECALINE